MLALLVPASASAQEVGAAATGLGQGPLHLDPSLRSALTDQERAELTARLEQAQPPVLVAILPLVSGDAVDGKPRQLLTVLRKRVGREDAAIATVQDGSLYVDWPGTAEDDRVRAASSVANLTDHDYNERIATTLNRFLDALADDARTCRSRRAGAREASTTSPLHGRARRSRRAAAASRPRSSC